MFKTELLHAVYEGSVSVAMCLLFLQINLLPFCLTVNLENDTATSEK